MREGRNVSTQRQQDINTIPNLEHFAGCHCVTVCSYSSYWVVLALKLSMCAVDGESLSCCVYLTLSHDYCNVKHCLYSGHY